MFFHSGSYWNRSYVTITGFIHKGSHIRRGLTEYIGTWRLKHAFSHSSPLFLFSPVFGVMSPFVHANEQLFASSFLVVVDFDTTNNHSDNNMDISCWRRVRESHQDLSFVLTMMGDNDDDNETRNFLPQPKRVASSKTQASLKSTTMPCKKRKTAICKSVRFRPSMREIRFIPSVKDMTCAEIQSTWLSCQEIYVTKRLQLEQNANFVWERQERRQRACRVVLQEQQQQQQACHPGLAAQSDCTSAAERIRKAYSQATAACIERAILQAKRDRCDALLMECQQQQTLGKAAILLRPLHRGGSTSRSTSTCNNRSL